MRHEDPYHLVTVQPDVMRLARFGNDGDVTKDKFAIVDLHGFLAPILNGHRLLALVSGDKYGGLNGPVSAQEPPGEEVLVCDVLFEDRSSIVQEELLHLVPPRRTDIEPNTIAYQGPDDRRCLAAVNFCLITTRPVLGAQSLQSDADPLRSAIELDIQLRLGAINGPARAPELSTDDEALFAYSDALQVQGERATVGDLVTLRCRRKRF